MPNKEYYVQQSDADGTGMFSLFKALGNTRTMTSGWTIFALKSMTVAFGSATVVGLTTQMTCAAVLGPVIPFLCGSTLGFFGGMFHRWHFDSKEALTALEEYPELLGHHIYLLGPASFKNVPEEIKTGTWQSDVRNNLYKKSLCIVALYGASDTLARIRTEREEQVIRQYTAAYAE